MRPYRLSIRRCLAPLSAVALSLFAPALSAQTAPPATDVFLASIDGTEDGREGLRNVRNVTGRDGYDNQPAFSADGATLFYTSIRDAQADIWAYDLASGETTQVTDTPESEYSPTPIPGDSAISVVRVEADGTQRLWRFPLDEHGVAGKPSLVLEAIRPVGYHAWLVDGARRELVLFVLDEPHRLVRVSANDPAAEGRTVASDIGRALHRIPGQDAFSFIHRAGAKDGGWMITRLDAKTDERTPLFPPFPEQEDLAWSPDGWVFMADGTSLYRRKVGDEDWQKFAQLTAPVQGEITRLAVSPDGKTLALVAAR
jgi:hypothetical protein